MNEITVRNSRVSDTESIYKLLRVIADLHRTARPDMFDGLVSKYTESEVEKRLSNEDNGVFVAEIEGAVVGYVFCEVIKEGSGNTLYIVIIGLPFVLSVISVIVQVLYYKATGGQRIFLMAPLHHHFQEKGFSECKIAVSYSAITLILGIICIVFNL